MRYVHFFMRYVTPSKQCPPKIRGLVSVQMYIRNSRNFGTFVPRAEVHSKFEEFLELNQTKSANAQTDRQTDELMRCGLFHWKWERISRIIRFLGS